MFLKLVAKSDNIIAACYEDPTLFIWYVYLFASNSWIWNIFI